jgi:hypothetical protein
MKNNRKINWNAISSIGTIIASIGAIIAIIQGNIQFRKSLELLSEERKQRNEEKLPLITINKNSVYGLKNYKQFQLIVKNIGYRPAYNLSLRSIIISTNDNLSTSVLVDDTLFSCCNPVNPQQEINFYGNIYLKEYPVYYIKIKINYKDSITKQTYPESFYFKWTDIKDKLYRGDVLYGIELDTKQKIDSLIDKMGSLEKPGILRKEF